MLTMFRRFEDGLTVEDVFRDAPWPEDIRVDEYRYRMKQKRISRFVDRLFRSCVPPCEKMLRRKARDLSWLDELRAAALHLDEEPQRIHRRIFEDAMRRAEVNQTETKGTHA